MRVVDLSGVAISASVNQVDAQRIKVGQPAEIRFDAYPDLKLDGRVSRVGAIAGEGSGDFGPRGGSGLQVKTIAVEIAFQTKDPRVIPDLSAAVDVISNREEDVLVAPRSGVTARGDENYVRVREGDKWVERKVETGASNAVETVILAGLEPGDEIAMQNPGQDNPLASDSVLID
jgi:HlyD family secretion protein